MVPPSRIASTSRLSHPTIPRVDSPRPLSNHLVAEVFKPKHPHLDTIREPWVLDLQNLAAATSEVRRDVVLVLGEPSLKDLQPILDSSQLSCSLVIIASHKPPVISYPVLPAICCIRLNAPLAGSSASRLMKTLDGAERLARQWRRDGGSGVREISESERETDPISVPSNVFRRSAPASVAPSLSSSTDGLTSRRASQLLKATWTLSKTSLPSLASAVDPLQRAFDAILNFTPSSEGSDRMAILSYAILLSGVARSYLYSASPSPPHSATQSSTKLVSPPTTAYGSRDSFHAGSLKSASSMTVSPLVRARLVHIIQSDKSPFARWLGESLNDYLLKLAHQRMSQRGGLEHPPSFVMPATALCGIVRSQSSAPPSSPPPSSLPSPPHAEAWCVADIILSGMLDSQTSPGNSPYATARAWIGGPNDFSFSDDRSLHSLMRPSPSASVYSRERLRDSGVSWNPMHIHADDQSSTDTGASTPPLVPMKKALHRPVGRMHNELPTPPDSDESSDLSSDHVKVTRRRSVISSAEKGKGVERAMSMRTPRDEKSLLVGKRTRWLFWTSRSRTVTQ
ncbi:hypothetical protein BJ138DRAFT_1059301 [Hygrophoropsis aurantiaca]|uniref:Uncharacterized protein n=1 Tax=Hygrophoropsis aurantiaca TaxID=72124 RepID=A0ACB8AJZ6_9AGAM|nr:hypothetical protein BJ138DRAFT_1059301 [Hygrophoropsis aurantiaca]